MLLSINDGTPKKLTYSGIIDKTVLETALKKLSDEEKFWKYHLLIIEDMTKTLPKKPFNEIWKKLTKAQKSIWTLGVFIGQTNNGGVWQFLFNYPQYFFAAAETFHEVKPISMYLYDKVLKEFEEMIKSGEFTRITERWNDQSLAFEEQWAAFKSGAAFIPSAKEFDDKFYSEDFKKQFYKDILKYIEMNLDKLLKVEGGTVAAVALDKKTVIPHYTNYLSKVFGEKPQSVSVYYNAKVTIDKEAALLFLMQYRMPNGYESIGISGAFDDYFEDVPMEEIKSMYQKHHKQELVNIYYGKHLVAKELAKNPKAAVVNEAAWTALLEKLQNPENSQVPVNVLFREYFKLGAEEWYVYTGDLLYNDHKDNFPKDLSKVPMAGVRDKVKDAYQGEINLIFNSNTKTKGFGRRSNSGILKGKYALYDMVGAKFKLLKDNPWGF